MTSYKINLKAFSIFRAELMGVATCCIILCHSVQHNVLLPTFISRIFSSLGLGVDIFLLLSGIGIYKSFEKVRHGTVSIYRWYIKRYIRIMIPLLLFFLPFDLWNPHHQKIDCMYVFLDMTGLSSYFGHSRLWFIGTILMLYLLTPCIDFIVNRKNSIIYALNFSLLLLVIGYFTPALGVIQRWPSYFIGYSLAYYIRENKSVSIKWLLLLPIVLYISLYCINHITNLHLSLFWLQGLIAMTIVTLILHRIELFYTKKVLRFMGSISLESYITNDYLIWYFSFIIGTLWINAFNYGNYLLYFGGTVICIFVSYLLSKCGEKILQFLKKN